MLATIILAMAATATAYWVETVSDLSGDAGEQVIALAAIQVVESVMRPLPFRELGTTAIGPEAGETLATFDDIDDFHGLVSSPPFDGDRQPQTDLPGWSVTIEVSGVAPTDLTASAGSNLRLIHVIVTRKEEIIAESWWLRARSSDE